MLQDYEIRMYAEYYTLCDRLHKLADMLHTWRTSKLDFVPICTYEQLDRQLQAMSEYRSAIEARNDFNPDMLID